MRAFVVLLCFLALGCLAQRPHPCTSPPLLSGAFTVATQNEKLWFYAKYLYDGLGERIRLFEIGNYQNQSFTYDVLLLYREGVMYEIDDKNKKCTKKPLKNDFQPMAIPKDASLLAQAIVGSSSGPGQGLLVNTWTGDVPQSAGKYAMTVTEFGCIPVSNTYHMDQFGWVVTNFFDNVIGIQDPQYLNPPPFCQQVEVTADDGGEPVSFYSLFTKRH